MDLHKINPWNWFKHEESRQGGTVPLKREAHPQAQTAVPDIWQLQRDIDRLFDDATAVMDCPHWLVHRPEPVNGRDFISSFRVDLNIASDDRQYAITLEAPRP